MLFAGTAKPIPRSEFAEHSPGLSVQSLDAEEDPVRQHFSMPEVQYVGSTSACGCDFPHLMLQNGGWPYYDPDPDPEVEATHRQNMEALAGLLRATGEKAVELYGIWAGVTGAPEAREEISLADLLDTSFHFKEQGFYTVRL